MSKLARPLFLIPALLAVLLACVLAAALQPSVQRWALRRALADRPGLRLEFAHFSAGLSHAEVRGVVFERPGLRLRAESLESDYSLWRFLLQGRLEVARLTARGVEVEVAKISAAQAGPSAAGGSAVAPGALVEKVLPWEIAVGKIDVAGRILLPAPPGRPAVPGEFTITGGDIAPGREGAVQFRLDVRDAAPGAKVTALHTQGRLALRQTDRRTFDQAALTLVVDAEGPRLTEASQLQLEARLSSAADGARYSLHVDTRRDGRAENLVAIEANAPARQPRFSGRWTVHAGDAQLEPFFLGGALPRFTLEGAGAFGFHTDTGAVSVDGALRGTASALEAIDPSLRALGLLRWDLRLDLSADSGLLQLNHLAAKVESEKPVATLELKRALTLDARRRTLRLAPGEGEVGRLSLHGLPLAWVRPFVRAVDVSGGLVTGEFVVTGDAQHLGLETAAPLRAGAVSVVREGALLLERADLAVGVAARVSAEKLTVDLRDASLATPAGDRVRAQLQLALPLQGDSRAWTVGMSGSADLPGLLRTFTPLAHLRVAGSLEMGFVPGRLDVRAFRGEVATGAGRKLLQASGTRPFAVDLNRLQLIADGAGEVELGRLNYDRVALDELIDSSSRLPLTGELAPGGFVFAAKGPRLFVRPATPVRMGSLGLSRDGQPALSDLVVQTSPTLDFGGIADWKLSDGATVVLNPAGEDLFDLNLEASAGAEGLRASASFNADLAALGGQPALASLGTLSAGRASGELRAAVAGRALQVELRSTMNGLVARDGNQALPVANLSLRAVRTADGRLSVQAPVLLDRLGQRSNLEFSLDAAPQSGAMQAKIRLSGDHLELADALALLSLAGGSGRSAPSAGPTPAMREPALADGRPFWSGWLGSLDVEVKEIVRGQDWALRDFNVAAKIEPAALRLEKLGGVINGRDTLAGRGEIAFRTGAIPYALQGGITLSEFDVGALLKALDPERAPVLEGQFSVDASFTGSGRTLDDTLARTRGSFELKSSAGVFRGLRRASDKVSVATKAVDAVAALGSLFGSNKVKEAAEKVAGQSYQVDQLAQSLAELTFEQCVIRAVRDERLNVRIDEFSLVSPEVRLAASGSITHVEGRPLVEQPLSLSYQLAARGRVEQTLGRLRALDGTRDELGYARAKQLGTLSGTIARPQSFLYAEILKFAESKLGDLFN